MSGPFPGGVESVAFSAAGERLVAVLYHAPGAGPHPVAVLLHGIPGSEKNHDLAYALREAGWHTLIVHFRGGWGSGGRYEMAGQVDDTRAALDWLLSPANPFPADPARLALVGYSLGSRAALLAATRDERVAAVVSIAGIDDFAGFDLGQAFWDSCAQVLHGVSGDDIRQQWAALGEGEQPYTATAGLGCPLLLVHGDGDDVVPLRHAQLLWSASPAATTTQAIIPGAGHLFAAHRREIVTTVRDWLLETLPG